MAKVGRNDPCPCGSGKRFKGCHGAGRPAVQLPDLRITNPKQTTAELPLRGMPGIQEFLTVVPEYKSPADPHNREGPQGHPGDYDLEFTFCRPGVPLQGERSVSFGPGLKGDSHLAITFPANESVAHDVDRLQLDVISENLRTPLRFTAFPNERGFLAKIFTRCRANSFRDAHREGFRALAPLLSNWSMQLDIPLLYQVDLLEVASGARTMTFMPPFPDTPLIASAKAGLPEFRGYASVYREALNSNSPVYQYLCFFKIIESVLARRARLGDEARERGETLTRPREIFPADADSLSVWLNSLFTVRPPEWDSLVLAAFLQPAIAGKRFRPVIENHLRPTRKNIAHALFETGELGLSVDEYVHIENVITWLPVAKCMVRRMLKTEFSEAFLSHLPQPS